MQCFVTDRTQNRRSLIQCDATTESSVRNTNAFFPSTRIDKYSQSDGVSDRGEEAVVERFSEERAGAGAGAAGGDEER